jgi:hypothetical protein
VVEAASAGTMSAIQSNIKAAGRYWDWQYRLLLLGGALFLAWHVMGLLPPSPVTT